MKEHGTKDYSVKEALGDIKERIRMSSDGSRLEKIISFGAAVCSLGALILDKSINEKGIKKKLKPKKIRVRR